MKLKKGDKVVIISGSEKGKTGTIAKILGKTERVLLDGDGIKKVKKHLKPSQVNPDGGIVEVQKPIHASNVMLVDAKTKKPTRIGFKAVTRKATKDEVKKFKQDEITETVRFAKKSGEVLK
ncbi:MAG: 50S ribosomal protein L24 [Candidatus Izemoplasmatales bacterium]|nr:50S ribosomal protein L24 [Candidatus Izemoplasmatales bacterium]